MNSKSLYNKPYKSFEDIVTYLEKRGLIISDRNTAETTLKYINYYRFKIYLRPLLNISTEQFKTGSSFDEAYQLYRFDDELEIFYFQLLEGLK